MKKVISVLSMAVVMTACNSHQQSVGSEGQVAADTAGLAQFQAMKQQAALKAMEDSILKEREAAAAAERKTASAATKRKSSVSHSSSRSESIAYESQDAAKQQK